MHLYSKKGGIMGFELPNKGEIVSLKEIRCICIHFGLTNLWNKIENDPPNVPFKSDGCSYWPDNWKSKCGKKVSLYEDCLKHDLHYWAGYPEEDIARFLADVELMFGVVIKTKRIGLGLLMFLGVRIGGSEKFKTSFRWGFGR
jgi:hypothetical protein